jgi:hypothetical protein
MQVVDGLILGRYGGTLMAHGELTAYNFLVVYLAIIQGTLAAGQWLSFGPSMILFSYQYIVLIYPRFRPSLRRSEPHPAHALQTV